MDNGFPVVRSTLILAVDPSTFVVDRVVGGCVVDITLDTINMHCRHI